jgi:hypothetical protein
LVLLGRMVVCGQSYHYQCSKCQAFHTITDLGGWGHSRPPRHKSEKKKKKKKKFCCNFFFLTGPPPPIFVLQRPVPPPHFSYAQNRSPHFLHRPVLPQFFFLHRPVLPNFLLQSAQNRSSSPHFKKNKPVPLPLFLPYEIQLFVSAVHSHFLCSSSSVQTISQSAILTPSHKSHGCSPQASKSPPSLQTAVLPFSSTSR